MFLRSVPNQNDRRAGERHSRSAEFFGGPAPARLNDVVGQVPAQAGDVLFGGSVPIHTKNTIVLNHEKLYFIFII